MRIDEVSPPLAEALSARGYESLTAVQSAVVAEEARGRDLIVSAQTGSGKTVAFGLAMAEQLIEGDRVPQPRLPLAIIIAPTRELALQVSRELEWLYARAGARILSCVGGMDPVRERRALEHGATIVVGTPGRLRDHLERGALDLSAVRAVVLDEADEMLDMGFREELEHILDAANPERRTLLFSATMPKPIAMLAKRYQKDALTLSTLGAERGHGDIDYQAVAVAPSDIENAVVNLLRLYEPDTAILFCGTREGVRQLHSSLVERGFEAVALSGEHSQSERNHALQALRDRRARVCVATDVAARGIDLPSLSLVIHAEVPRDPESLQHRSGRTGRAGRKGTAVLVVPYQRRRRVDALLKSARVPYEWVSAPSPEAIHAADRERLLAALAQPVEFDDEDKALGAKLLETRPAEEIAAMLVRAHRARLPAPEELVEAPAPGQSYERQNREQAVDSVWFRINIGRRHNADPRWLLPLLCRRGHVTKAAIGAIRIGQDESAFEIPREGAARFLAAVKRTARDDDDGVMIIPADGAPPQAAPRAQLSPRPPRSGPGGPPGGGQRRPPQRPRTPHR